jgi:hypothetical protein
VRAGKTHHVETLAFRLATRLDALAAAHMLRARGHTADLPRSSVADGGHTLIVRANSEALPQVQALIEHMFPDSMRCHESHADEMPDGF